MRRRRLKLPSPIEYTKKIEQPFHFQPVYGGEKERIWCVCCHPLCPLVRSFHSFVAQTVSPVSFFLGPHFYIYTQHTESQNDGVSFVTRSFALPVVSLVVVVVYCLTFSLCGPRDETGLDCCCCCTSVYENFTYGNVGSESNNLISS